MEDKTYYEILGISPKCTLDEIKVAYRKLIKNVHPDKCNDETDIRHVKLINKAYEILKNPFKRNEYDNSLKIMKKKGVDFIEMQQGAKDFYKTHKMSKEEFTEAKCRAEIEYAQKSCDLDSKMGINKIKSPTTEELEKQILQLETLRDQEYIENIPNRSDEKDFQITRFNKEFDSIAENKYSLIQCTEDIQPYNEIDACKINEYDNVPTNKDFSDYYRNYKNSPIKNLEDIEEKRNKETQNILSKNNDDDDDDDVQENEFLADYTGKKINMNRRKLQTNFERSTKSLEDLVEERNKETQKLLSRKMYNFNNNECINASGSCNTVIN